MAKAFKVGEQEGCRLVLSGVVATLVWEPSIVVVEGGVLLASFVEDARVLVQNGTVDGLEGIEVVAEPTDRGRDHDCEASVVVSAGSGVALIEAVGNDSEQVAHDTDIFTGDVGELHAVDLGKEEMGIVGSLVVDGLEHIPEGEWTTLFVVRDSKQERVELLLERLVATVVQELVGELEILVVDVALGVGGVQLVGGTNVVFRNTVVIRGVEVVQEGLDVLDGDGTCVRNHGRS